MSICKWCRVAEERLQDRRAECKVPFCTRSVTFFFALTSWAAVRVRRNGSLCSGVTVHVYYFRYANIAADVLSGPGMQLWPMAGMKERAGRYTGMPAPKT